MAKQQQRAELAHWLHEARLAEREMAAARDEAQKWLARAKLAHQAGNQELVEEAANRARQERTRYETAKARLEETQREQSRLKSYAPAIGGREARYADELLELFKGMGIDPTASELDQLVEEESLKAKMVALQKAAGIEPQPDPLALLRARMAAQAAEAAAMETRPEEGSSPTAAPDAPKPTDEG